MSDEFRAKGNRERVPELDVQKVREQFPTLQRQVHGKPLVYLDNAATTQKPQVVLDAILDYYTHHNANVHRGVHTLGDESTQAFLDAHEQVAQFFGAHSTELILSRNTTEAINWTTRAWGDLHVRVGDVVMVSLLDHHSNFVPWQQLCLRSGAELVVVPVDANGQLDMVEMEWLITKYKSDVKVLALPHVSNALGSVVDLDRVDELLRAAGVREQVLFVVDAAQSAAHLPWNFAVTPVDVVAFSGHKLYGPMGIGGALVKSSRLPEFSPVLFGGGMIDSVKPEITTFADDIIDRYTAGTPDVASMVGLAAAGEFIRSLGWETVQQHEHDLMQYGWDKLSQLPDIELLGPELTDTMNSRVGSISWQYKGVHAHDVAQILDRYGVAVRSGHHCTMPLHTQQQWLATTRASFAIYNTRQEIETLVNALQSVKKVFIA